MEAARAETFALARACSLMSARSPLSPRWDCTCIAQEHILGSKTYLMLLKVGSPVDTWQGWERRSPRPPRSASCTTWSSPATGPPRTPSSAGSSRPRQACGDQLGLWKLFGKGPKNGIVQHYYIPVSQFLDRSFWFPQILMSIRESVGQGGIDIGPWVGIANHVEPSVLCIQLRLELSDPGLHLGDRLLAAPQRGLLGFVQPGLCVLHLQEEAVCAWDPETTWHSKANKKPDIPKVFCLAR